MREPQRQQRALSSYQVDLKLASREVTPRLASSAEELLVRGAQTESQAGAPVGYTSGPVPRPTCDWRKTHTPPPLRRPAGAHVPPEAERSSGRAVLGARTSP